MDIRKQFIVFISLLFCAQSLAQNFTVSPTSEQSRYEGGRNIHEEENDIETFTAEPDWHQQLDASDQDNLLGEQPSQVNKKFIAQIDRAQGGSGNSARLKKASAIDYKALAAALRAGCASAQTSEELVFPFAAVDLDVFFIIPAGVKASWLPPRPTNPDATIKGVDADGDCVRDDIEYYIAGKYKQQSQQKLRKYLYEYAAWLDRFLIANISVNTAKTASNNMVAAGECVRQIIGDTASRTAINDLFAKFHNTFPRSYRYLDNLPRLGGWTTRETIAVSCP